MTRGPGFGNFDLFEVWKLVFFAFLKIVFCDLEFLPFQLSIN